ncbi:hypothetical protein Lal_00012934 [Lupinus albus]|nr:hypothetical protein Lal_00012934 [Lupinus albus]
MTFSSSCSMASSRLVDQQIDFEESMTLQSSKIPNHLMSPKNCLIGKLFSYKPQVHANIPSIFYTMWNKPKGFICEEVKDRIYRFYFQNEFDANMKMRRQPWNYKGKILVLRPWKKGQDLEACNFNNVPFSIQVWGLPLTLRSANVAEKLCSHAGNVLEVGIYNDHCSHNSIPKAMVLIDISKPLTLGTYLDTNDYGKIWADFKYENLPTFCYYCGKIGGSNRKNIDNQYHRHHHQNQLLMPEKDYNTGEVDKVSHQLSSLYVTKNQLGVTKDEEPNPMLTIENLQPSLLKFDIGCNSINPSLKSKNKVKMSGYKSQKHDSQP